MQPHKTRYINAGPVEEYLENRMKSFTGTFSGPAYMNALERVQAAPTVEMVPLAEYNAMRERLHKLQETANILDAALREYQQKYGE